MAAECTVSKTVGKGHNQGRATARQFLWLALKARFTSLPCDKTCIAEVMHMLIRPVRTDAPIAEPPTIRIAAKSLTTGRVTYSERTRRVRSWSGRRAEVLHP